MTQHDIASLYNQNIEQMYRYVLYRVRHVQSAEDIVSDTFRKALEHRSAYIPQVGATPRSWLYALLRNCMIDALRKQRYRMHDDVDSIEIPTRHTQEEYVDFQIDLERSLRAIEQLPESQKECLLLRLQAGLQNREIAAILGVAEKTVAAHISRGMKELKKQLSRSL